MSAPSKIETFIQRLRWRKNLSGPNPDLSKPSHPGRLDIDFSIPYDDFSIHPATRNLCGLRSSGWWFVSQLIQAADKRNSIRLYPGRESIAELKRGGAGRTLLLWQIDLPNFPFDDINCVTLIRQDQFGRQQAIFTESMFGWGIGRTDYIKSVCILFPLEMNYIEIKRRPLAVAPLKNGKWSEMFVDTNLGVSDRLTNIPLSQYLQTINSFLRSMDDTGVEFDAPNQALAVLSGL